MIDTIPTEKEHLSQPELVKLANTDCKEPVLKKAFLFSCLTGLRKSDIKALTWKKIQPYSDGGMYITVRMRKTQQLVNNPVSEEALELIGFYDGEHDTNAKVFPNFRDKMTGTSLKNLLKAAGITKHITFHSTSHSISSFLLKTNDLQN